MRSKEEFLAVVSPGLEAVARRELEALGLGVTGTIRGGVTFEGSVLDGIRVNFQARTVGRVWMRLSEFRAKTFPELFQKASRCAWARYVAEGSVVEINATADTSRLYHSGRIESVVRDAIAGQVAGVKADGEASQTVLARIENDRCTLSIDMSGEVLHRRGALKAVGRAPLRETMASALLQWAGWTGQTPLVDPMCGSGTFLVEGAWIAAGREPGLDRPFAFETWPKYDAYGWRKMKTEAQEAQLARPALPLILGADRNQEVLDAAQANAARADLEGKLQWVLSGTAELAVPEGAEPGLLVCNPPYGKRIASPKALEGIYKDLGKTIKRFKGWSAVVVSSRKDMLSVMSKASGLKDRSQIVFRHGGLKVTAVHLVPR